MKFSAARSELDSTVVEIELTLVSIIQGVALTILIENAHAVELQPDDCRLLARTPANVARVRGSCDRVLSIPRPSYTRMVFVTRTFSGASDRVDLYDAESSVLRSSESVLRFGCARSLLCVRCGRLANACRALARFAINHHSVVDFLCHQQLRFHVDQIVERTAHLQCIEIDQRIAIIARCLGSDCRG